MADSLVSRFGCYTNSRDTTGPLDPEHAAPGHPL